MKWYFASNDKSHKYNDLIKAAVISAKENTTLEPYFIYDGKENELTEWLKSNGVHIIYHRSNLYDALQKHYQYSNALTIASGAFLRCDIPILEKDDDFVLYTDCDVIFNKDIDFNLIEKPQYFSCSQEINKNDYNCFNTGVMIMNIKNLRETYNDFCNYIKNNFDKLYTFDQTAYQFFYGRKKLTILPEIYNHKPYWGINDNAVIIHYHGPKPNNFKNCNNILNIPDYITLFQLNPKSYLFYLNLFQKYSPETIYEKDLEKKLEEITNYKYKNPLNIRIKNFLKNKLHLSIK